MALNRTQPKPPKGQRATELRAATKKAVEMDVKEVLRMNGGIGETSYATNSLLQKKVISITKPIMEEAIAALYRSTFPTCLAIADLGCSSGPNTFSAVSGLIRALESTCKELGRQPPDVQVFLNDLPGNDFNTMFRSLPKMNVESRHCLFAGVPGSFYGRLFLSGTLHFVHSSYSLMWLSQVPEGVEENNKGNIYMASTSPTSVLKAYYRQFQSDFSMFLKCRAEEVVEGGRMVLTLLGRRSEDPSSKDGCYIWELLATVLNQMVSQGLIEQEKLDAFNIPQYTPSPWEVESEVVKEGSFAVGRLEVSEVNWNACGDEFHPSDATKGCGYNVAGCMRAVAEPLLVAQFGEAIMDEVFSRYGIIVSDRMAQEKTEFINVTVSLIRKGI